MPVASTTAYCSTYFGAGSLCCHYGGILCICKLKMLQKYQIFTHQMRFSILKCTKTRFRSGPSFFPISLTDCIVTEVLGIFYFI